MNQDPTQPPMIMKIDTKNHDRAVCFFLNRTSLVAILPMKPMNRPEIDCSGIIALKDHCSELGMWGIYNPKTLMLPSE